MVRGPRPARPRRGNSGSRRDEPAPAADRHDGTDEMKRMRIALTGLLLAAGCGRGRAGGPPKVPVAVARVERRAIPYELLAAGSAEPRQTAAVEAQVTGVLTQVTFHEGDEVAAGQVLFQIDPRP